LDKNIKLLDCPGIVFAENASDSDIVLRNAVKIEKIVDPIEPGSNNNIPILLAIFVIYYSLLHSASFIE
jgi:ribosome biogenesis GTPase A